MKNGPEQIFSEYRSGKGFKSALGSKGLYEQSKVNERFYSGDQWYGAKCGNDRPLVRYNLIKRIGDYKMSVLLSSDADIAFFAEGIPATNATKKRVEQIRFLVAAGQSAGFENSEEEIALVTSALNDYHKIAAKRLKIDALLEQALKNAYISGTGVIYSFWDSEIPTGLYVDDNREIPIKGDVKSEVIDIENVYFGDPECPSVQSQPYIIIASCWGVDELKRYAVRFGASASAAEGIRPDSINGNKATVLTKLYKKYSPDGKSYKIYAKMVSENAVIREEWDIGVRKYPLSVFRWETRKGCAYGESEITYLIPNQIAVNRMLTSGVWSAMSSGMPTLVVNGDVVDGEITNDPGQIIKVFGSGEDVANALRFVSPPDYSGNFQSIIGPLVENTLAQSGANPAALGDVDPDNTSAILTLRNAAMLPLKMLQNRYYEFMEEVADIWAEFWITQYGSRRLKIEDENGVWYMPFDGDRYRDLIICANASVTAPDNFDTDARVKILDRLLERGDITLEQYLRRLPSGMLKDADELIRSVRGAAQ